jgi:superfamily II DNA helicase RecQ
LALKFFRIPVEGSALVEAELNAYLSGHKVLRVTRELVERESSPGWAVCVEYMAGAVAAAAGSGGSSRGKGSAGKIDYREVLSAEHFTVYLKLRELRKELAQKEGVPVYAVFTNEQLAEVAKSRPQSLTALGGIAGIGEAKVGKFGDAVLGSIMSEGGSPQTQAVPDVTPG